MLTIVMGGPKSGKSLKAEAIISDMAAGTEMIYIATMMPYGKEGQERILKHRQQRADKNFKTIECFYDLNDLVIEPGSYILLECISNLVANELFEKKLTSDMVVSKVIAAVEQLNTLATELVVVSTIEPIKPEYDDETRMYIDTINRINENLTTMGKVIVS